MNEAADPAPENNTNPVRTGRLSFAIFTLARAHRAYAAELLRKVDLHPGQELLLMQLMERDGQTQAELLAAVGLDHSTVSKSLKRMQERGLVEREPTEEDRRVMRVRLTPKGEALRKPLEEMWATLERTSVRDLDERTVDHFVAIGETVTRSILDRRSTPL
ncbi:MarR family winged helix-turn-helix transcriptional regulator [Streptomyces sp. NBC_01803]|uniref:MarR family winged helix-turn-helix transcriptional regulator n=1 Tax=Streptomyces sp. NBC_01803 TaxID=2975946 RepID=UPI002DDAB66E|nr:MarR family transcriptional regulator [Streptomyces sp. NBC_01803]WSA47463.1 MarR family transcriptional regulator [Streptomyces sp. NBC_01803]